MNLAAFAKVMSEKLVKQLADAGLSSLHAVLEHLGILTFSCDLAAWEMVFFVYYLFFACTTAPASAMGQAIIEVVSPRTVPLRRRNPHEGRFFKTSCAEAWGKLNAEELKDTCDRLKAVGFGPGHTCALRMLAMSAAVTLFQCIYCIGL